MSFLRSIENLRIVIACKGRRSWLRGGQKMTHIHLKEILGLTLRSWHTQTGIPWTRTPWQDRRPYSPKKLRRQFVPCEAFRWLRPTQWYLKPTKTARFVTRNSEGKPPMQQWTMKGGWVSTYSVLEWSCHQKEWDEEGHDWDGDEEDGSIGQHNGYSSSTWLLFETLFLPPGFIFSHLTYSSTPLGTAARFNRTMGVCPMVWRILKKDERPNVRQPNGVTQGPCSSSFKHKRWPRVWLSYDAAYFSCRSHRRRERIEIVWGVRTWPLPPREKSSSWYSVKLSLLPSSWVVVVLPAKDLSSEAEMSDDRRPGRWSLKKTKSEILSSWWSVKSSWMSPMIFLISLMSFSRGVMMPRKKKTRNRKSDLMLLLVLWTDPLTAKCNWGHDGIVCSDFGLIVNRNEDRKNSPSKTV